MPIECKNRCLRNNSTCMWLKKSQVCVPLISKEELAQTNYDKSELERLNQQKALKQENNSIKLNDGKANKTAIKGEIKRSKGDKNDEEDEEEEDEEAEEGKKQANIKTRKIETVASSKRVTGQK